MKNNWGNPSNIIKNQQPTKYAYNSDDIFVDTERILSKKRIWEMSEIAIRDHLGIVFSTHIKPWFEIHESWSFSKVSRQQLYETGMELNDAMRIASFYIKNKNAIAWNMDGEKQLIPNVLSKAKTNCCAMKRFDPYRGVYNFSKGNYHFTKLKSALQLIGFKFKGRGHHNAIEDVNALKKIWDWMNVNPISTSFVGRIYE